MMSVVARVLDWIGKTCDRIYWSRLYFFNPPNESDPEELELYRRRLP